MFQRVVFKVGPLPSPRLALQQVFDEFFLSWGGEYAASNGSQHFRARVRVREGHHAVHEPELGGICDGEELLCSPRSLSPSSAAMSVLSLWARSILLLTLPPRRALRDRRRLDLLSPSIYLSEPETAREKRGTVPNRRVSGSASAVAPPWSFLPARHRLKLAKKSLCLILRFSIQKAQSGLFRNHDCNRSNRFWQWLTSPPLPSSEKTDPLPYG